MRVMARFLAPVIIMAMLLGMVGVPGVAAQTVIDPGPWTVDLTMSPGQTKDMEMGWTCPDEPAYELIEAEVNNETPLEVTVTPASYSNITAGETYVFTETVYAPFETPAGEYQYTVTFRLYTNVAESEFAESTKTVNVEVIYVQPDVCPVSIVYDPDDLESPIIKWDYSQEHGNEQQRWEVQVWTQPDHQGTLMWSPQRGAGDTSQVVYDGKPLNTEATYYASVRAYDGLSWSDWCEAAIDWPSWDAWIDQDHFKLLKGQDEEGAAKVEVQVYDWSWETLEFSAVSTVPWMSIGAFTNTTVDETHWEAAVDIDTAGMALGEYEGEIIVTTQEPIEDERTIEVYLEVVSWVDPHYVELEDMFPGRSVDINKNLLFDVDAPQVDVFFLVDDTESFAPYLEQVRQQILIMNLIGEEQEFPEFRFGLGTFRDFPEPPFGAEGDFSFKLLCNLSTPLTIQTVVEGLLAEGAGDEPESQYEALYQAATSTEIGWGEDAYKVIVLATDATFHDGTEDYPGKNRDEAVDALEAAGITVVGWGSPNNVQLQDVAVATGGSVVPFGAVIPGPTVAEEINVESDHPYANHFDYTWWLNYPTAVEVRVHFDTIEVENHFDNVHIVDGDWNTVQSFTGNHYNVWTDWVDGDTIGIRLTTDGSVTYWGFLADMVEVRFPTSAVLPTLINDSGILSIEVEDAEFSDWVDIEFDHFYFNDYWGYDAVAFNETISVPIGTPGGTYEFTVNYYMDGEFVDYQTVVVEVPCSIEPRIIETELFTGDCLEIEKWLRMPGLPVEAGVSDVEILLLQDETGSYWSYMDTLKALAPQIFDAVQELLPGARFGVAGFGDFPISPWGDSGDVPYRLVQDLTTDRDAFVDGVNQLYATGGADGPESQYEALYQAATGAGNLPWVAPGGNPTWSDDAGVTKIILLATDASFHCPDTTYADYPGPTRDTVVNALNAAGITVIGIEPSTIAQLHDVAEATGGTVVNVDMSGEGVAEAIVAGLEEVAGGWTMIEPVVIGEHPFDISFDPEAHYNVSGEQWIKFVESICVPEDAEPGTYSFTIEFRGYYDEDSYLVIAEQEVEITVFDQFDWINMVYMAADNDLGWYWADEALYAIDSADYYGPVRTVILYDGPYNGDSQIYQTFVTGMMQIDDEGAVIPAKTGEVNMGDAQTLESFITWVMANYPSDNYALSMWDHGAGWRSSSFCIDYTDNDSLSMIELGEALDAATDGGENKLQVIAFDACLMQMLEVDYQVMNYAEYAVGSQEVILAPGMPYDTILSALAADSTMTAAELATLMVDMYAERYGPWYWDEYHYDPGFPCGTLSAKDLSQIAALTGAVEDLAQALLDGIGTYDEEIAAARVAVQTFGDCDYWYDMPHAAFFGSVGSIDLQHFAELLLEALPETDIAAAAAAVIDGVENAVIANWAGDRQPDANGIAIYYPDFVAMGEESHYVDYAVLREAYPDEDYDKLWLMVYEPCYDTDTSFAGDTAWAEFLKKAPRLVEDGVFVLYIPDVVVIGHVAYDPIIRLDWPEVVPSADGFTMLKPVEIVASPAGSIDLGVVLMLYSEDDLKDAGLFRTQLMGQAQLNGEQWELLKLTMNLPTWLFEIADLMFSIDPGMGPMGVLADSVMSSGSFCVDYSGAVLGIPWLDLDSLSGGDIPSMFKNVPDWRNAESTTMAIAAVNNDEYLNPIQAPQMLSRGWNLISVPVIPLNGNVADLVSGYGGLVEPIADDLEVIWEYDAAADRWRAYSPAHPDASDLTRIKDGKGYWVKMADDAVMTVIGSNMLAGPNVPPSYEVVEGWNLIGYTGILPMPADGECGLAGYLEDIDYSRKHGWNRAWDGQLLPSSFAGFMQPNEGYWIFAKEAGTIAGSNDCAWVHALQSGAGWEEAAMEWIMFWALQDAELGMRLAWNAGWYALHVAAPNMLLSGFYLY